MAKTIERIGKYKIIDLKNNGVCNRVFLAIDQIFKLQRKVIKQISSLLMRTCNFQLDSNEYHFVYLKQMFVSSSATCEPILEPLNEVSF